MYRLNFVDHSKRKYNTVQYTQLNSVLLAAHGQGLVPLLVIMFQILAVDQPARVDLFGRFFGPETDQKVKPR